VFRLLLTLVVLFLSAQALQSQPCKGGQTKQTYTTKCAKILSILVDACGTPEGENEILLMATGSNSLNLSNLSFTWANASNKWLGLTQNSSTASKLASINAGITGCGKLIEPKAGTIPPQSLVYVFTSTAFTVGSNSFVNLNDTAYAIFQTAGNTAGHFSNYATPAGLRTTILRINGSCNDTATYERTDLIKQNGSKGAEDGAYVEFDANGNPTYKNDGCNAPAKALKASITPPLKTNLCAGDSVTLTGKIEGSNCFVWRTNNGRFADSTKLTTTFFPGTGSSIAELWVFNCKSSAFDKISFTMLSTAKLRAGNDTIVCAGNPVKLSSTGGIWGNKWNIANGKGQIKNDTLPNTIYTPSNSDTLVRFVISAQTGCFNGTDTMLARFNIVPSPKFTLSDTAVCVYSDSVFIYPVTKGGKFFSTLNLSVTPAFKPVIPGTFTIIYKTVKGACSDSFGRTVVVYPLPTAAFSILPSNKVVKGSTVNFQHSLVKPALHEWFENGIKLNSNTLTKQKTGTFNILHRVTDSSSGCSDTASQILTVFEEDGIYMANVFTPNEDSLNEIFNFIGYGVAESNLKVYNRWGEKLFESDDQKRGWNGKTPNGIDCPDGTYFWQLYVKMTSGKNEYHSGTVNLLR
jgi:gliding motility-associated-like protein